MVGVPGRSKGCNTCRKRRVKCDELKPFCQRCSKGGFDCLGYERERLWRNASTVPFQVTASIAKTADTRSTLITRNDIPLSYVASTAPPQELGFIAFRDDMVLTFMFTNHVWQSSGVMWLDQAARGKMGQLSLDSASALAHAYFGRCKDLPAVKLKGLITYGQCLTRLSEQLETSNNNPAKLIVPILVLLIQAVGERDLYTCFMKTWALANATEAYTDDRTGAISHFMGLAKLLHICGPEAFQEQPLLNAFESARSVILIGALIAKRRTFLDSQTWCTIPWLHNEERKIQQSKLIDIFLVVPGLLQDHAVSESSRHKSQKKYHKLLEQIKRYLTLLYRWRWAWQALSGHEVDIDTSYASPTDMPERFPRLSFRRFAVASELMLYNAALMWLIALLFKLEPVSATAHIDECGTAAVPQDDQTARLTSFQPFRRPGAAVTVRDAALETCRAFEWVAHHPKYNTEPTYLYLFPIGMAMTALKEESNSRAWIRDMLSLSPVTADVAYAGNQAGFASYLSREDAITVSEVAHIQEFPFSEVDMQRLSDIGISDRRLHQMPIA